MSEIEDLQMKLSHVKRDFNNLSEEFQYTRQVMTDYIRAILRRYGYHEEAIDQEIKALLKPRPQA